MLLLGPFFFLPLFFFFFGVVFVLRSHANTGHVNLDEFMFIYVSMKANAA